MSQHEPARHRRKETTVRKIFKRMAAAAAIGIAASVAIAAPAWAVRPGWFDLGDPKGIYVVNDARTITIGEVTLTYLSDTQQQIKVCDYNSDGYYVIGQVKSAGGSLISYQSLGVGTQNCFTRTLGYGIADFRFIWKDYTSPWFSQLRNA
jgi:hypothetical protein